MDVSDFHLEKALEEYNSSVNMLESNGTSPELVEAYVNRGCILYMMGYLTSAMEDLSSATDMMEEIESEGGTIDVGTFVKSHATKGAILFEQNFDASDEYELALSRLRMLRTDSRHFDMSGIIRMCVESAENLLDSNSADSAMEFVAKALDILDNSFDRWSENRKMELHTLMGECFLAKQDFSSAIDCYSDAITVGTDLVDSNQIEDMEELIVPIISRSQCESELGLDDMYLKDLELSIGLMEEMVKINKLTDTQMLVSMHQEAASALMAKGKMEEAEKHLLKAVSMGVHGAQDYIRNQTNTSM